MSIIGAAQQQDRNRAAAGIVADPSWFVFTVDTLGATTFIIPSTDANYKYRWEKVGATGTNSGGELTAGASQSVAFGESGIFKIFIVPGATFKTFRFNNGGDKLKMKSVEQWGTAAWYLIIGMFSGCTNMTAVSALDYPVLSGVYQNSLSQLFKSCTSLTSVNNFQNWPTSTILNFSNMFDGATLVNPNTTGLNVSGATTIYAMFYNASAANPDTTGWVTTSLVLAGYAFANSSLSSKSLGNFNMKGVTNASGMLSGRSLSTAHYNDTLIAWANQAPLQSGVTFHAGASTYDASATSARNTLTGTYTWTITGDSLV